MKQLFESLDRDMCFSSLLTYYCVLSYYILMMHVSGLDFLCYKLEESSRFI